MTTVDEMIQQVNAYADFLATFKAGTVQIRTPEAKALRRDALMVLEAAQDWPEVETRDGQHIVLQAPDGSHVLYSVEWGGEQRVERLTRLEGAAQGGVTQALQR